MESSIVATLNAFDSVSAEISQSDSATASKVEMIQQVLDKFVLFKTKLKFWDAR